MDGPPLKDLMFSYNLLIMGHTFIVDNIAQIKYKPYTIM